MESVEQTQPTPIEAPIEAPRDELSGESVYGDPSAGAYSDASRALAGELKTQLIETEAAAAAKAEKAEKAKAKENRPKAGKFTVPDLRAPKDAEPEKAVIKPPPGQRFGLSEERKQQLAAELKARNEAQAQPDKATVATAAAPAKVKTEPARAKIDPAVIVGDHFDREDSDPSDLLGRIYDQDYDRYERLVEHVIANNRDHALRLLGVNVGALASDPEFAHLPEDLRQVAADMRPDIWESMSLAHPSEQEYHLRNEQKIREQERAEAAAYEAKYKEIEQQARDYTGTLMADIDAAHMPEITKMMSACRLFGDGRDNDVGELISNSLWADIMASDWGEHLQTLTEIARRVPLFFLNERPDVAERAETYLRAQMADFYAFVKGNLEDRVGLINELKQDREDARLWREHQKRLETGEAPKSSMDDFDLNNPIGTTGFYYRKRK